MKCVFFTHQQYNVDKIHIPKESLVYELNLNNKNDDEISVIIDKFIDYVYQKLNEGNMTGIPIKIPMPIFVLIGRKLDYDRSVFDGEKFDIHHQNSFNYGNAVINPQIERISPTRTKGTLAIVDFLKSFFISDLGEPPMDEEKYKNSLASVYKFKGNRKVIIYFPYISTEYKYITNFRDVGNSLKFFFTLISKKNFLNFQRTSTIDYEKLRKQFKNPPYSDEAIKTMMEIIKREEGNKYSFYDDLHLLCKEGGCIADEGEDFTRLLPEFTEDEGKNNENALKYSPFLPNKCLAQTKGYLRNIRDANGGNLDVPEFIKKEVMEDIKKGLSVYLRESEELIRTGKTNVGGNEVSNYKSPVDLIINFINKKIKDKYSNNLNDGDKRNYYSREYSQNIIKELSFLRKIYPGIPEIIMSLYLYKEEMNKDKIIYMPWGRTIISKRNVISVGDLLEINKKLYSFNNRFYLTMISNGLIFVVDKTTDSIIYFINRNPIQKAMGMTFETNGFAVEYIDSDNNYKSMNISVSNGINKLVGDCEECRKPPYSLILNDNDGTLNIYSNSFYDATDKGFKNFMEKEKKFINEAKKRGINEFNINNPEFIEKNDLKIDIKEEEDYLFCADIDKECKK
jgi:hypothetical protein